MLNDRQKYKLYNTLSVATKEDEKQENLKYTLTSL